MCELMDECFLCSVYSRGEFIWEALTFNMSVHLPLTGQQPPAACYSTEDCWTKQTYQSEWDQHGLIV